MHLILTLGTNPLPVVVAGKNLIEYFSRNNSAVTDLTLIISKESEKYQDAVLDQLAPEGGAISRQSSIVVNSGNPKNIYDRVFEAFQVKTAYHLHYTGGTKALAVHCWQAIIDRCQQDGNNEFSASYLNPRDHQRSPLIMDDRGRCLIPDCRKIFHLDIDSLLKLPGYINFSKPKQPPSKWPMLLFNIVKIPENMKNYNVFYENQWVPMQSTKSQECAPPEGIEQSAWREFCQSFNSFLQENYGQAQFDCNGAFQRNDLGKNKLKKLKDEITGKFLEYAVYEIIEKILINVKEKNSIRSNYYLYNSITPVLAADMAEAEKKINDKVVDTMELDVVVILGYQLLLFSCTTLDVKQKGAVKLKAMEAMHRAQQIGGEEARAVVVSSVDKITAAQITAELYEDCGRGLTEGLLEIWGLDAWEKIDDKIDRYIRNTIRWS